MHLNLEALVDIAAFQKNALGIFQENRWYIWQLI
jgi:hypothetical protein